MIWIMGFIERKRLAESQFFGVGKLLPSATEKEIEVNNVCKQGFT